MVDSDAPDLLRRAQGGSQEAFTRLLSPHLPMLLAYTRTIVGDFHAAQDAVQETALIAFRKLHLFFKEADFASWLKAIARREALSLRRERFKEGPPAFEGFIEATFDEPSPEALTPEREALAGCLEALGRADARTDRVLRAHYFEGAPLASIAATMEINLNTVKTLLHRARLTLQDCAKRKLKGALS